MHSNAKRPSRCGRCLEEVLVLRARYWHRLPGQYFMDVLESYLRLNQVSLRLSPSGIRSWSDGNPASYRGHNYTFVMAASFGPDELPTLDAGCKVTRFVIVVGEDLLAML